MPVRLIAINYPTTNQSTQFTYDGLRRRVRIVEKTGATATSTKQFFWDGLSLTEERHGSGNQSRSSECSPNFMRYDLIMAAFACASDVKWK